jgi:hypothetical protein
MRAEDKTKIIASEVKFWIRAAKNIWINHKRNENKLKELETDTMLERISDCKIDWIQHYDRMKRNIIKKLLIAKVIVRFRNRGRIFKRLVDKFHLEALSGRGGLRAQMSRRATLAREHAAGRATHARNIKD